jgi:putative endopeptidase
MRSMTRALAAASVLLLATVVGAGTPPAPQASGLDLAGFDRTVRPQDDLFRHVNGGWLARTQIPASRPRWGSFDRLQDESNLRVRAILDSVAPDGDADAAAARAMYASFMGQARVDALGAGPLAAELARIAALADSRDLVRYFGGSTVLGVSTPVNVSIGVDAGDPDAYIVSVWQGGLGLPDREYYLQEADDFVAIRAAYLRYLERLFTLAGIGDVVAKAAAVVDLESALAAAQWTRVANRDPLATYNRVSVVAAMDIAPGLDWAGLFAAAGLPAGLDFVLAQPSHATALATLLQERPLDDWRSYLQARLLDAYAPYLSQPFVEAHFEFNARTLTGVTELRERWRRGVELVNGAMGFAVGREYVARHFPPAAKARMDRLVNHLLAAMGEGIDELDWMGPATRAEARAKLARINAKIGYPDVWRSYAGLEINADDLVGNVMRATAFEWRRRLGQLGGPVDRSEWGMTPQTVNAYYRASANEIVFPAAILQPPFFNFEAEDAVNYGAIGAVIGHEISHGFDDRGRRYDGEGRLRDWWTPEDDAAFRARTERLVEQFNAYRPLPDATINGRLSLGENIADLSGVGIAWRAWQRSLGGREAPVLDGYSGAQRFFLGYGQIWRVQFREAALRRQLLTGPHSPGEFRANGSVANFQPFYEAFGLREGDGLWRPAAARIRVW